MAEHDVQERWIGDSTKANVGADQQVNILAMLIRHSWLIAASLIVCSLIGGAYYIMAPKTYHSLAELFVETKNSPALSQSKTEDGPTNSIETHASLLTSSLILKKAIEHGNLDQLSIFRAIKNDQNAIIRRIKNRTDVSTNDDAPILTIAFGCADPADAQAVVASIAESYEAYLGDKSLGLSVELTELIAKGKDDLLRQLQSMEQSYAEFRSHAPVLWKDGAAVNIHRERQVDLEQNRKELLIQKHLLDAKIAHLITSIAQGGDTLEAASLVAKAEIGEMGTAQIHNQRQATESAYSQRITQEIVDVMMQEKEVASQFGDGHPELEALRSRLDFLKQSLQSSLDGMEVAQADPLADDEGNQPSDLYVRILQQKADSIDDQLARLDEAYTSEEVAANEVESYLSRDHALRMEIERSQQLFDAIVARLDEINIIQDYAGERASIIEPALYGTKSAPDIAKCLALSLMCGLGMGLMLAYRMEVGDTSFTGPNEVRDTIGAPILAQVPEFSHSQLSEVIDAQIAPAVATHHQPHSPGAEIFRGLRTGLYFNSSRQKMRVLQVTSPLPGDGKSTVITNLAVSIAQSNRRVVIVDADCRRPTIHTVLGIEQGPGLVDVLNGTRKVEDVILKTNVENLFVIRSGIPPRNPSELLTSDRFDQLLKQLGDEFDQVLVDTTPALAVSDCCTVAAKVDGVLLVLRMNQRSKDVAVRARQALAQVNAQVIGIVLNGLDPKLLTSSRYGKYGPAGYGSYATDSNKYFQADAISPQTSTQKAKPKPQHQRQNLVVDSNSPSHPRPANSRKSKRRRSQSNAQR